MSAPVPQTLLTYPTRETLNSTSTLANKSLKTTKLLIYMLLEMQYLLVFKPPKILSGIHSSSQVNLYIETITPLLSQ